MDADFKSARTLLMTMSLSFIVFYLGGAELLPLSKEDVSSTGFALLGLKVAIKNTQVLVVLAWLVFIWSLVRYIQYALLEWDESKSQGRFDKYQKLFKKDVSYLLNNAHWKNNSGQNISEDSPIFNRLRNSKNSYIISACVKRMHWEFVVATEPARLDEVAVKMADGNAARCNLYIKESPSFFLRKVALFTVRFPFFAELIVPPFIWLLALFIAVVA